MNNVYSNQTQPLGVSDKTRSAALNNRLASAMAAGDPRMSVKKYDRPGLSRGGAQMNQAGIDAAQTMSQGISDAYSQDLQTKAYNAQTTLQGQQSQEQFGQALAALQQQQNYANQMAALQRQGTMFGLLGGLFDGLFDL